MSVAYDFGIIDDFAPVEPARPRLRAVPVTPSAPVVAPAPEHDFGCPERSSVAVLRPPVEFAVPAPLRLTSRGRVVLALAVALIAGGFVWLASASAPASAPLRSAPATVTVQPGDTLWGIAARVAPQSDPGAVVADLERVNHLAGVDLTPGEVLRLR